MYDGLMFEIYVLTNRQKTDRQTKGSLAEFQTCSSMFSFVLVVVMLY